ncbi:MAG: 4Fe-4S ferredoxin [Candidatus Methanomethylicia archaeon]
MNLLKIWVKTSQLHNADIVIFGECVRFINSEIFEKLSRNHVVLTYCPEAEGSLSYGKIASIIRSSKPKSIRIVTIDGSPHCFTLHTALNEALYILNEDIDREHYVLVDGKDLVKISPDTVRIARYLHIVDDLLKKNPEALSDLIGHSLEYKYAYEKLKPKLS